MGIALTIIAYDTRLASLTSFEEQETGMNFEQMLEQASEELQAVMKGFAPSSESALQRNVRINADPERRFTEKAAA
jgi:hypothetical protein